MKDKAHIFLLEMKEDIGEIKAFLLGTERANRASAESDRERYRLAIEETLDILNNYNLPTAVRVSEAVKSLESVFETDDIPF